MTSHTEQFASMCARALLAHSPCEYDDQVVAQLDTLSLFLSRNKTRLMGAALEKYQSIIALYDALAPCRFDLMLRYLVARDSLSWFGAVVVSYNHQYKTMHGAVSCVITSSHALSDEQKMAVSTLVGTALKNKVVYACEIDQSLIAGIRVESETFVGEQSVAQRLRLLAHEALYS